MTYLNAKTAIVDVIGRGAAPSTNPEYDLAVRIGALPGSGIRGWFGRTALGKALLARMAERELDRNVKRLSELSPHLLDDIGIYDMSAIDMEPQIAAQEHVIAAAKAPVETRAAQRSPAARPVRAGTKRSAGNAADLDLAGQTTRP